MAEKDDRTIDGIRGIEGPFGRRDGRQPYKRGHPGHQGFTTRLRFDTAFEDSHKKGPPQEHISNSGPFICIYLQRYAAAYSSM